MTLRSRIVGRLGSFATIFRFVVFAASIAFECFACTIIGLSVIFSGLLPLVFFHFPTFSFEVSELTVSSSKTSTFSTLLQLLNNHHKFDSVFNSSQFHMPSSLSSQYPPSTTAYPHLNQLLDCLHLLDTSSPSSVSTHPSTTIVSPQATSSIVRPLPPICSLLPSFSVSSSFDALPLLP